MVDTNSLKTEVLEKRVEVSLELIRRKARQVVQQFREHPRIIPDEEITLCRYSDEGVMEQFRGALQEELNVYGYRISLVSRAEEQGYSINVDAFLGIPGNGKG